MRELATLFGARTHKIQDGIAVSVTGEWIRKAKATTYFRIAVNERGDRIVPYQTLFEASANGWKNKREFIVGASGILSRQMTRYSAHGLHDYRGKFNPQVVRAIGNIIGMTPGKWLLDPFCGSGTSLLEAYHSQWNAVGIDMNPLGVEVSRSKLASVRVARKSLENALEQMEVALGRFMNGLDYSKAFSSKVTKSICGGNRKGEHPNREYLASWFSESVLVQLARIKLEIDRLDASALSKVFTIALSDILRAVSWQDPADLRIRRRKEAKDNYPVIPLFIKSLRKKVGGILKARRFLENEAFMRRGLRQLVVKGDCRKPEPFEDASRIMGRDISYDAAITSPPYVTALPYIDTQRLNLLFLGLLSAKELGSTEKSLIGTREIGVTQKNRIQNEIENNVAQLPEKCIGICRMLLKRIDSRSDGFRRRNSPALLYKYFVDMREMFAQVKTVLKPGAPYALVVGRNRFNIGGHKYIIDTPRYLCEVAHSRGFAIEECIELNAYQRFDVHMENSIRTESLMILRNR